MAIPARNPVVTGTDKRFAIQPRRKNPAPIKMVPTTSASATAKPAYSGVPMAAKVTRPPAKIGVMVESAPADRKRLAPKAAKPIDPATNATKPMSAGKPAKARGGHLLGYRDGSKGEPRRKVPAQVFRSVAGQRRKDRPRANTLPNLFIRSLSGRRHLWIRLLYHAPYASERSRRRCRTTATGFPSGPRRIRAYCPLLGPFGVRSTGWAVFRG